MSSDLIFGQAAGDWIATRISGSFHASDSAAIGLVRDGRIVAGVMFDNINGQSLMVHQAIEGRITPRFLHEVARYAFVTCNVKKMIGPVPSDNAQAIRLVLNMGFREEARIKDAAPRGDIILFTLRREDCRFLGERYGEKRHTAAAA